MTLIERRTRPGLRRVTEGDEMDDLEAHPQHLGQKQKRWEIKMIAPKIASPPAVAPKLVPAAPPGPGKPPAPGQPKIISPMPGKGPTTVVVAPPSPSPETLTQYVLSGMNFSAKACVEGEGKVCSLLQKACAAPDLTAEEKQYCAAVPSVCQSLDGFDVSASICLVKSVPLSRVCDSLPADQRQACMAVFQS